MVPPWGGAAIEYFVALRSLLQCSDGTRQVGIDGFNMLVIKKLASDSEGSDLPHLVYLRRNPEQATVMVILGLCVMRKQVRKNEVTLGKLKISGGRSVRVNRKFGPRSDPLSVRNGISHCPVSSKTNHHSF